MINWANFVSQVFNGLALGALLALISSGLTIIYGTLGVLNLAHGAMFMLGGYAGYVAYGYTGSFVVAVLAGSLFVVIAGRRDGARSSSAISTIGRTRISFWSPSGSASVSSSWCAWSSESVASWCRRRRCFAGITSLGFMFYPTYRLAVVGIIAVALTALFVVLYRTRIGMIVRPASRTRSWSMRSASTSTASS